MLVLLTCFVGFGVITFCFRFWFWLLWCLCLSVVLLVVGLGIGYLMLFERLLYCVMYCVVGLLTVFCIWLIVGYFGNWFVGWGFASCRFGLLVLSGLGVLVVVFGFVW